MALANLRADGMQGVGGHRRRGSLPLALVDDPGLAHPALVTVAGWTVVVAEPVAVVDSLAELDALAADVGWRDDLAHVGPPFAGGAVGFLTDDLAPGLLDLAPGPGRPSAAPLPPLWFGVYDSAVCFPPGGGAPVIATATMPPSSERDSVRRRRWEERIAAASRRRPDAWATPGSPQAATSMDRDAHARAVWIAQDWIAAGLLYQLNLTMQITVPWAQSGAALARALWKASPGAAHAAWLRVGGTDVVSVSPETFLRTDGDRVSTRPIKGTRPRSRVASDDQRLADALRASEKDAAEHVMIVDLERNDLGRVCEPGTVRVASLAALEAHPTVWHLTSAVEGRLRPTIGFAELLTAMFPSGSVTGAPKRMAWDRIRRLEPVRRGAYCGAIGVVTRGRVDLSVAIRTAVLHDGVASYGTGGGIVADSEAGAEWEEAMDKAAAFLRATGAVRPG